MRFSCLILLCLFSTSAWGADDLERLRKGKIIVRLEKVADKSLREGVIRGTVDASPSDVFSMITDYDHYEDFIPKTKVGEIREQSPGRIVYLQRIDIPWPLSDSEALLEATFPKDKRSLKFQMIPGTGKNIKNFHGSWKIEEFEGDPKKSLVMYRFLYESTQWIPGWMARIGMRRTIAEMIRALRRRWKVKQEEADLGKTP